MKKINYEAYFRLVCNFFKRTNRRGKREDGKEAKLETSKTPICRWSAFNFW